MAARALRRYGRRTMATTPAAAIPGPLPARRELAIDAALAGIALGITLLTLDRESRALGADAVALSLIAALPILAWRRAPLAVFLLTSAASVATNALGHDLGLGVVPGILVFLAPGRAPAQPHRLSLGVVRIPQRVERERADQYQTEHESAVQVRPQRNQWQQPW